MWIDLNHKLQQWEKKNIRQNTSLIHKKRLFISVIFLSFFLSNGFFFSSFSLPSYWNFILNTNCFEYHFWNSPFHLVKFTRLQGFICKCSWPRGAEQKVKHAIYFYQRNVTTKICQCIFILYFFSNCMRFHFLA